MDCEVQCDSVTFRNMLVINELSSCPRRESNSHLRFRKPPFYPLNYGDGEISDFRLQIADLLFRICERRVIVVFQKICRIPVNRDYAGRTQINECCGPLARRSARRLAEQPMDSR